MIASEWLKFRSLRSTLVVLGAAMLGMVLFAAIIAFHTRNPTGKDPEDLVASGPLQGYYLGQLLLGALGVLVVTGDYGTGMIRSTLAAVPKRLPVLIAKTVVFAVVVGAAMIAASLVAFYVAQAVLSGHRATFSLPTAPPCGWSSRRCLSAADRADRQCPRLDRPQHPWVAGRHLRRDLGAADPA